MQKVSNLPQDLVNGISIRPWRVHSIDLLLASGGPKIAMKGGTKGKIRNTEGAVHRRAVILPNRNDERFRHVTEFAAGDGYRQASTSCRPQP